MVEVTIEWLLEACDEIIAFGGLICKSNLKEYVTEKTVQTNLTHKGITAIENGQYDKRKFIAVLPKIGIAECFVQ